MKKNSHKSCKKKRYCTKEFAEDMADTTYFRHGIEMRVYKCQYCRVIITLGYPSNDQKDRIMKFPWRGYEMKTILSEEWDYVPQEVFAIKVIP